MKMAGTTVAAVGLSSVYAPVLAKALEKAAGGRPSVVWLHFASDTGCSESVIKSAYPSAAELVLDILSIDYDETIMAAAGEQAEKCLWDAVKNNKGKYVCIVEGGIPTADGGKYLTIGGKTGLEIFKEVGKDAAVILAIGSCSFDGGVPAAAPNVAKIKGVMDVCKDTGVDVNKVINLPCCPVNPEWVVSTLVQYLLLNKVPTLDKYRRPLDFYGQTIHENCERRSHFEAGRFVEKFGTQEEVLNYCLFKMGCKGPETYARCPITRWNDKQSWCVAAGSPCIGCAEWGWQDKMGPFYVRSSRISLPGLSGVEVTGDNVGKVLGVATAVGIAGHAAVTLIKGKSKSQSKEEKKGDN